MARTRKLSPERKAFINGLIEHYHPEDAQDVQEMLKDLLGDTLQGMLEAEMDEKLGYSKYDYKNKETDDSRNGYSKKTVVSSLGEINLDVPRDRKGEFEPQAIKKNQTIKKAVYLAIGIKLNGNKEVLGMWIGGNESAKYWLGVLNEIKNRGVEDIMIVSVDSLTGFGEAIGAVFPKAEIQRCIVHQIRFTAKFVNYKDLKPFVKDLKAIYQAPSEDSALSGLDELEEKWGKKYPSSVSSWRNNWPQLSTFLKYPEEIRKIIYTTNAIENFNRGLRKVTKAKSIFPRDDALFKSIYLAMIDITKKWTGAPWNWGQTLNQLCIYFGDRITPADLE